MIQCLIIDPQNDFCEPAGALFVPGAQHDMERLAGLVAQLGTRISDIHLTLDAHHFRDIAHPVFWIDAAGVHPPPFTMISQAEIESGKWRPANPANQTWAYDYTGTLEANARYALCIWPPHCLIGSWGGQVEARLFDALRRWEDQSAKSVDFILKGMNPLTEHYSAFRADVPRPDDPATLLNLELIEKLLVAEQILIAGEALSHCVRFSTIDLLEQLPREICRKIVVLADAMSPVPGFAQQGREFLNSLAAYGVTVSTCEQLLKSN